jgi:hypothetical protein
MTESHAISTAQLDLDHRGGAQVIDYDSHSLDEYATRWAVPTALGEMVIDHTQNVADRRLTSRRDSH